MSQRQILTNANTQRHSILWQMVWQSWIIPCQKYRRWMFGDFNWKPLFTFQHITALLSGLPTQYQLKLLLGQLKLSNSLCSPLVSICTHLKLIIFVIDVICKIRRVVGNIENGIVFVAPYKWNLFLHDVLGCSQNCCCFHQYEHQQQHF